MIWCYNLNLYALILFWKIFFFFLKNVYKIATKPKPTEMREGFIEQCLGCSDKAKFGIQCFGWMALPISKSFRKDPLRGWRSFPCKETLSDWFHTWHTSWDEDFLICGEDSCKAQELHFHVNHQNGLSRQCATLETIRAIWVQQEEMLMQFPEILMGHCHPDVE